MSTDNELPVSRPALAMAPRKYAPSRMAVTIQVMPVEFGAIGFYVDQSVGDQRNVLSMELTPAEALRLAEMLTSAAT